MSCEEKLMSNHRLITYNLQLFAEGDGGEKTEQPTAKKKNKAREEGQVAKSVEITTAFLLIIIFSVIKYYGPRAIQRMIKLMEDMFALFGTKEFDKVFAVKLLNYVVNELISIILPILALAFAVGLLTNLLQVGWKITTKPLQPKLSKFNPVQGVKKIFSAKSLIELLKSILKIAIISVIIYMTLKDYEILIIEIYNLPVLDAYIKIANICLDIGIRVGMFFIVIALADYIYQRYSLNKKLKMTKQEVKEEFKQAEGNPEIKQKIRQKMREAAMRRMMQDVPTADVIITNPTHFAVAVKYDPNSEYSIAPLVVAKGADLVAAKIKEIAKENAVEIIENRYLARTLYYSVEIGEEIPPELYQAVAEILAVVYAANQSVHSNRIAN